MQAAARSWKVQHVLATRMTQCELHKQNSVVNYRHAVGGAVGRAHVTPHAIHWAAILVGVPITHRAIHVCLWPCNLTGCSRRTHTHQTILLLFETYAMPGMLLTSCVCRF
jgi:hypothetical protein